jgi:hypothetical protein
MPARVTWTRLREFGGLVHRAGLWTVSASRDFWRWRLAGYGELRPI